MEIGEWKARSVKLESRDLVVVVTGLTSEAGQELNGRVGIVKGSDKKSGRIIVCFDASDPPEQWKKLRPENLRLDETADVGQVVGLRPVKTLTELLGGKQAGQQADPTDTGPLPPVNGRPPRVIRPELCPKPRQTSPDPLTFLKPRFEKLDRVVCKSGVGEEGSLKPGTIRRLGPTWVPGQVHEVDVSWTQNKKYK